MLIIATDVISKLCIGFRALCCTEHYKLCLFYAAITILQILIECSAIKTVTAKERLENQF